MSIDPRIRENGAYASRQKIPSIDAASSPCFFTFLLIAGYRPSKPGVADNFALTAAGAFAFGMPCWWQSVHLTQWMLCALVALA